MKLNKFFEYKIHNRLEGEDLGGSGFSGGPVTPEQLEKQRQYREEYLRSVEEWKLGRIEEPYKNSKFINRGNGEIVHKKGIDMEYWDEAEVEEYLKLADESKAKREEREQERKDYLTRLSE